MKSLQDCARIATIHMDYQDRDDYMQSAILFALEKGLERYPAAYIIKAMKNHLYREMSKNRPFVELPSEIPSNAAYSLIEMFADLKPRSCLLLCWIGRYGIAEVAKVLGEDYQSLRFKWMAIKRKIKED